MAEEEKTEQTEQEEPQAPEVADDAASDAAAAGPVADDAGAPADAPEGEAAGPVADDASSADAEDPPSAPPAEDAAEDDAPSAEAADEPAEAEAAPSEPEEDPLADLPWKERARLLRSREPGQARPQRSAEERAQEREAARRSRAAARRRYRESAKRRREPGTGTPPAERHPNAPKVRQGVVVSDRADKTITVRIDIARRHRVYEKVVRQSHTLHAHDERNEAGAGDVVRVVETRPLSKLKRWRLLEVVEKAR